MNILSLIELIVYLLGTIFVCFAFIKYAVLSLRYPQHN